MTEFEPAPPQLGLGLAFLFGAGAAAFAGSGSGLSLMLGGLGIAFFVGGLFLGEQPFLTMGAVFLFMANLARLVVGGDLELSILGTVFAITAWDVGEHAHDLGQYVGREGRSDQAVLTHAMLSVLVGIVPVGLGYVIYSLAPGGRPLSALVLLLLAALFVVIGLRR